MQIALKLLLGRDTDGAAGFTGPLTPEAERWALDSLARVEENLEG